MKFIRNLFGKRRVTRVSSNWSDFKFPSDVLEPEAVGVFSSSDISSAWSAVYMARALQNVYSGVPVHFVAHSSVAELAGFLPVTPQMHIYTNDPGFVDPAVPEGVLMFSPQPGDDLLRFVEKASPLACVSTQKHPAVNIRVKTSSDVVFPGGIYDLMKVLKMETDTVWKPTVPGILAEKASSVLSPVSHRTLPYILATEAAANVLERKRAEVPLKIVLVDGKSTAIPPETSVGLLAAMVAGASAVATTDRDLWIHARALGIPVIGLDRKGAFNGWGGEPAPGDTKFLEQWATLIRIGW
ncbi:MAG: hypothetical protein J7K88_11430 [Candidatus Fermentibacteraceae bacterium]|nr:hypothetical protein [Candidatus Fermentibacteraceae bacterium]